MGSDYLLAFGGGTRGRKDTPRYLLMNGRGGAPP
jgi:hypothetical protein